MMSYEGSTFSTEKVEIILIQDKELGGYTATSKQFPESTSEGNTKGEAIEAFGAMVDELEKVKSDKPDSVDNFDQIKGLLDFSIPNTMYFIQILQRRKDNPGLQKDVRVINNYYIYEAADMVKLKARIVEDCTKYNARAYMNLNRLDTQVIALNTMKSIADYLLNGQYQQVKNAYATSCGNHHSEHNKKWVVDIDTKDKTFINDIFTYINELYVEAKSTNKILACIPTKNGVHLICNGFRMDKFMTKFPGMTVTKNSPTVLYINL